MQERTNIEMFTKKSLKDLQGKEVMVNEYSILCRPITLEEQLKKGKSNIITLSQFNKKINGETHAIATEDGKIHIMEVIEIGSRVQDIKKGDFLRIAPTVPDNVIDFMVSSIIGEPMCVISSNMVIAILR